MSDYNALQVTLRKTGTNLSFLMGYTYAKTTDWDSFGSGDDVPAHRHQQCS